MEVFPGSRDSGLFQALQRAWRTGEGEYLPVYYYRDERISGWRESFVYKLPSASSWGELDHTRTQDRRGPLGAEPGALHPHEQPAGHGIPVQERQGLDHGGREPGLPRPDGIRSRRPRGEPDDFVRRRHPPRGQGQGVGRGAGGPVPQGALPAHVPHRLVRGQGQVGVGAGHRRVLLRREAPLPGGVRHRHLGAEEDPRRAQAQRGQVLQDLPGKPRLDLHHHPGRGDLPRRERRIPQIVGLYPRRGDRAYLPGDQRMGEPRGEGADRGEDQGCRAR